MNRRTFLGTSLAGLSTLVWNPVSWAQGSPNLGSPTLPDPGFKRMQLGKLQVVGRLDLDTTGLVLITDDGQWSHRITSPRHECAKTYRVWLADPIAPGTAELFAEVVLLRSEKEKTRPAQLEILGECEARLTIHEGKYHQVKRMFAAVGNKVIGLHREQIGALALDEALEPGEYRELSAAEVALF